MPNKTRLYKAQLLNKQKSIANLLAVSRADVCHWV